MAKKMKMDAAEASKGQAGMTAPLEPTLEEKAASGEEKTCEQQSSEEEIMCKLQAAEKTAAENFDKFVRVAAELENYKKRAVREKADAIKYGNESLLRDILPLVDSVDRALEHAGTSEDFEAFKQGLKLLHEQLLCCLKKHGVELIDTAGKDFDPNVHEAMLQVVDDERETGKVVNEFERGYLLNGRLLRPAKVCVCKRSE
ncbi:MAG: nucleotide exchange factor GrpE [Deltaproteobacteria bacterium]|nr:nucleotide exchange factor GrpE [Deltaproteobacteria bacterium]